MSKSVKIFVVISFVILGILLFLVIRSQDDSPNVPTEDLRRAELEWAALDSIEQNIACNIWIDYKQSGEDDISTLQTIASENDYELDVDSARVLLIILERECDEYL